MNEKYVQDEISRLKARISQINDLIGFAIEDRAKADREIVTYKEQREVLLTLVGTLENVS